MLERLTVNSLVLAGLALLAGCQMLRQIGSQCPNGRCEGESAPVAPTCVISSAGAITLNADGETEEVDSLRCSGAKPSGDNHDHVGERCAPEIVPEGGFSELDVSLVTPAAECGSAPCLVYHLEGDPSRDCAADGGESCASERSIEDRVYCSCRCDVPEGQKGPECDCPNGFLCSRAIEEGPFAGSYCVRNL